MLLSEQKKEQKELSSVPKTSIGRIPMLPPFALGFKEEVYSPEYWATLPALNPPNFLRGKPRKPNLQVI